MHDQLGLPGRRLRPGGRGDHGSPRRAGFRVNINCTLFNNAEPERVADFFDDVTTMGVDGITVSPGYAYERAPDQQHFLNRAPHQGAVPRHLRARQGRQEVGVQPVEPCSSTSWPATRPTTARRGAIPTRNYFGWQRPCYLLGEGYAKTFKELMEETDWDATAPATTRNAPTAWCIAATRRPRSPIRCSIR